MRILIVEDDCKVSSYMKRALEEKGYAVDATYTGQEGLDWAVPVQYDVIILDILLPEMSGVTVCAELRDKGNHTPILMLTARATLDDRVTGLDAGEDDYLIKPFALRELMARVHALTRRPVNAPRARCYKLWISPWILLPVRLSAEIKQST